VKAGNHLGTSNHKWCGGTCEANSKQVIGRPDRVWGMSDRTCPSGGGVFVIIGKGRIGFVSSRELEVPRSVGSQSYGSAADISAERLLRTRSRSARHSEPGRGRRQKRRIQAGRGGGESVADADFLTFSGSPPTTLETGLTPNTAR